jgi:hypothetical protein
MAARQRDRPADTRLCCPCLQAAASRQQLMAASSIYQAGHGYHG